MTRFDKPTSLAGDKARSANGGLSRIRDLQALQQISQMILESDDLNVLMNRILEKTLEIGKFEIGMIRLLDPTLNSLEPIASLGYRDPQNVARQRKRAEDPSSLRVIAHVMATKTATVKDLGKVEGMRTFKREGVHTMITVPLRTRKDVLGVIHLGNRRSRVMEPEEIGLLEAIGTQAGIAVQKMRLFEAAERRAREQEALNAIAAVASQSLDLNELFQAIADKTVEVTGRQRLNFRLKDPVSGEATIVASRGFTEHEIEMLRRVKPHPMSEQVFASGEPLVINDRAGLSLAGLLEATQSVAWIPIKATASVVGVLSISDDQSRPFLKSEVALLQAIGNQMGIAIQRARLYEETIRQARELEKANRMQADFAAMIAHDLRSPLMNISGAAEVIMNGTFGGVTEEQKQWLARISSNSRSLVNLVSDFLDIAKLEAGFVDLRMELLNPSDLIENAMHNFLILAREKQIALVNSVSRVVPSVRGDRRRLDQVMGNLLSNAIKFTPKGGKIEVGAEPADDGAHVVVWVRDTGIGIPFAETASLFEKYRQGSNIRDSGNAGTGLGLVICKMVVQAHGGRIWVESEPGKGSTFRFSLPAHDASRD